MSRQSVEPEPAEAASGEPRDSGSAIGSAEREPLDLRLAPATVAAWLAVAWALGWSPTVAIGTALGLLAGGFVALSLATKHSLPRRAGPRLGAWSQPATGLALVLVVTGASVAVAGLRVAAAQSGPLPELAVAGAHVRVTLTVTSDPVRHQGSFAPYVVLRGLVARVTAHGVLTSVRSPVLVIGEDTWATVRYGEQVDAFGRLQVAEGADLAAVLVASGPPTVTKPAGMVKRGVDEVRQGLREAASGLAPAERALVPALVDGDDARMPDQVAADFTTTGLTHLLAVSGSNLTLVLGFVLFVARWCRVRAHGLLLVGLVAVVFFVLLARPQPSVLRAAAMGVVALGGLAAGGRRRGARVLCVAVVGLLLVDPWLARSAGFLLSTLATAGILLLVPSWKAALSGWLPSWLAEAIAVPTAAQLVCTPAIAVISGQVSLVAVAANLLAGPAVGPATVLGLLSGLVAIVSAPLGRLGGHLAGVPAGWIVWVAEHAARMRGASMSWPVGALPIIGLCVGCLLMVAGMPALLRRRPAFLAVAGLMVVLVIRPVGILGWPPTGWVMVMCDVGQGDGLVLNAGHGAAVIVDTGPDPPKMAACLDRLEVRAVPLVVLTHFHADHVDGLPAVLSAEKVSEIEVSPTDVPPAGAAAVRHWAAGAGVPVTAAVVGEHRRVGDLRWTVLGPLRVESGADSAWDGDGSTANNASVVMLVKVHGVTLLLGGDAEPEEQTDILDTDAGLAIDVLKVPHHGSARQDPDFLAASGAPLSLISVGADNDYGHPASQTLALLRRLGAHVYRTDLDGDIAVVKVAGQLSVLTAK